MLKYYELVRMVVHQITIDVQNRLPPQDVVKILTFHRKHSDTAQMLDNIHVNHVEARN